MLKFLFLLIFFSMSLPGFSQEGAVKEPLSPEGGQVIIENRPEVSPEESVEPTANESQDVEEVEAARKEYFAKMKQLENSTIKLDQPILNPIDEMQKLGHKQLNTAAILDDKVIALMQKTLKMGLLSNVSSEELKKLILEKIKGSNAEGFVNKFPKLLDVFVEIVKDKDALSGLLGILIRKDDLKEYGYLCLALFVFGLYVKSRIIKPKWPFFRRFRYGLTASLVLTAINLYLFYSYFKEELGPTFSVISKFL
jgi:hypothetical protein